MESKYYCSECKCSFVRKFLLDLHNQSNKHLQRADKRNNFFSCNCGKTYTQKRSLDYHIKNKKCEQKPNVNISTTENILETVQNKSEPLQNVNLFTTESKLQTMQDKLDFFEKEHYEMKAQIAMLLEKTPTQTTNMTNSNNNNITITPTKKKNETKRSYDLYIL